MKEIHDLREQLTRIVNEVNNTTSIPKLDLTFQLPPPSRSQKILLRQIIAAGLIDQVAKRIPEIDSEGRVRKNRFKFVTLLSNSEVSIHPTSALFKDPPEYVLYHQLVKPVNGLRSYMKGITVREHL